MLDHIRAELVQGKTDDVVDDGADYLDLFAFLPMLKNVCNDVVAVLAGCEVTCLLDDLLSDLFIDCGPWVLLENALDDAAATLIDT